jgi:hypothetical protein
MDNGLQAVDIDVVNSTTGVLVAGVVRPINDHA